MTPTATPLRRVRRAPSRALALLAVLALAPAAEAQRGDDVPENHPSNDPYTEGDPEVWEEVGIVSMGGFEFGKTDTATVDEMLPDATILWIETEHFELGFALGSFKVGHREKEKIRAELTELGEVLPNVNPKDKVLDPWLRAHLMAWRAEKLYDRFLELVQVEDESVFPGPDFEGWTGEGTYWGEGPHLGQPGKYEILMLPNEGQHVHYLRQNFGLSNERTQRWNVVDRKSITMTTHERQASLRNDTAMHAHLAFNLAHNMLDGFKFYAYDAPLWLREGLAHYMEREISPEYNTFDGGEGSVPEMTRESDWASEVLKMTRRGRQPRLAELIRFKNYGDFELDDHFATWSMIDFLATEHPDQLAGFIRGIKGITNEEGYADGSDLPDKQRDLFRELWGWTFADFDEAWATWAGDHYGS